MQCYALLITGVCNGTWYVPTSPVRLASKALSAGVSSFSTCQQPGLSSGNLQWLWWDIVPEEVSPSPPFASGLASASVFGTLADIEDIKTSSMGGIFQSSNGAQWIWYTKSVHLLQLWLVNFRILGASKGSHLSPGSATRSASTSSRASGAIACIQKSSTTSFTRRLTQKLVHHCPIWQTCHPLPGSAFSWAPASTLDSLDVSPPTPLTSLSFQTKRGPLGRPSICQLSTCNAALQ